MDGKPIQLICGEIDPGRVPVIYWENRLRMIKAMGCNSIAMYVFWNDHEKRPGQFDFKSENYNIAQFIRICQKVGLWVLLRPGPYVCGERDFGGLPSYLLKIPDIKVRCSDPRYLSAVKRYIDALSIQVRPLLVSNGGPILMVQVENEYGSYANDKSYLNTIKKYWLANGCNVPFFTADGPSVTMLTNGTVEGAAVGLDSGSSDSDFELAAKVCPNRPSFSSETYPGWLTNWGSSYAKTDTTSLLKDVSYLMTHKKSVSFYVVHGGTNFGFTSGANSSSATDYQPQITSYDYDAPINEQGQPTPKYFALRRLLSNYSTEKLPDVPPAPDAMEIASIEMKPLTSVWNVLPKAIYSAQPKPMEMFDQESGFILYRTKITGINGGTLTIKEPHDFALVLLNGHLVDTIFRDQGKWSVKLPKTDEKEPVLEILVEGMGRINFGEYIIDRKGITDRVILNGVTLMGWNIFPLPMTKQFVTSLKKNESNFHDGVFFEGTFTLDKVADTYYDMKDYGKGVVWVNGHNLGRFWKKGPQQRLYCPANYLQKGTNKVVVFDLIQSNAYPISGVKTLE
jgi:beta-galactosidase